MFTPSQDCLEGGHEPSQKVSAMEAILGGHLINPPGFAFKQAEAQKGDWARAAEVSGGRGLCELWALHSENSSGETKRDSDRRPTGKGVVLPRKRNG